MLQPRLLRLIPALLVAASGIVACAQDTDRPLYARDPADAATLNSAGKGAVLEVLPDSSRVVPNPLPGAGAMRVRLLDRPGVEVEIPYSTMVRFETFPQRLVRAANDRVRKRDFGEAYEYFARLERDYPREPGYREAMVAALRAEAAARLQSGEQDHALAILAALSERAPRTRGLAGTIDKIGDEILKDRWDDEDYPGVRRAIDTLQSQFKNLTLSVGDRWIERMQARSEEVRRRAEKLAAAGKSREALIAANGALALNPTSARAQQLVEKLAASDRTVRVAVWQAPAPSGVQADLDAPAARRQARLLGGRLATLDGYEPTGGIYGSAFGDIAVEDGRRRLRAPLPEGGAFRVARALLNAAPDAANAFGLLRRRAAAVSVDQSGSLVVNLREPHAVPVALLANAAPDAVADVAAGQWAREKLAPGDGADSRYARVRGRGAFDQIEEYVFDDFDAAIDALRSQEVHVLAGVPAWKLSTVESSRDLVLGQYRLPSLHALLLSDDTPLRKRRELRRAVCYAIAREEVLKEIVLGGEDRPGFELLSAPAPRGVSLGDALRYGYNDAVEPRPYEPRLAAILVAAARAADRKAAEAAKEAGQPPPTGPLAPDSIVLAHAPTPTARLASLTIAQQLGTIGLPTEVVEASEADLANGWVEYDLRYAEVTMGEPLVDIWRLLGPGGLSGDCSPAMLAGLEEVVDAPTGKAARAALLDLHRVIFADLPLIPLWQTVDHFAHLKKLRGVASPSVDLYQSIDAWWLSSGGGR